MEKYTLKDFNLEFLDDDACLKFIKNARWPNGVHCSKCDKVTSHHRIEGRKVYSCALCGSHVPRLRVPFSTSPVPRCGRGSTRCS